jgi:hypothetical protein
VIGTDLLLRDLEYGKGVLYVKAIVSQQVIISQPFVAGGELISAVSADGMVKK